MSEQTVSFSAGSDGEVTPDHQKRNGDLPKNCERELVAKNVCIYDGGDLREHFNSVFKASRDEYNAKQKRKSRKVADDYYEAVKNQTETYGKGDKAEKAVYQDIIQIGNRRTNGITDDFFDYEHYKRLKKKDEKQASDYCMAHLNKSEDLNNSVEILTNIGKSLCSDKYPNIIVHSAYIHLDEPNGTPHLDIIYSIVALDEKRGPSMRVSMNKGLSAMGYKYQDDCTQLEQFRIDMKDEIARQMEEYGMKRVHKNEGRKRDKTRKFVASTAKECESYREEQKAKIEALEAQQEALDIQREEQDNKETELNNKETELNDREIAMEKDFQGREDRLEALQRSTEERSQKLDANAKKFKPQYKELKSMTEEIQALEIPKWFNEQQKEHLEKIKKRTEEAQKRADEIMANVSEGLDRHK